MEIIASCKKLEQMTLYGISELRKISVRWDSDPNKYYTIIMYKELTNYVHMIAGNILGDDTENSTKIYQYLPPGKENKENFENGKSFCTYIVQIYEQKKYIDYNIDSSDRQNFDVQNFVSFYNLNYVEETRIIYNRIDQIFHVVNPGNFKIIRKDSVLNPNEKKYCEQLISNAEKQPGMCNFVKAWMEEKNMCNIENPFYITEKEIGIKTDQCPYNYDYDKMSVKQLTAFCNIFGLEVYDDANKNTIINKIKSKYDIQNN